MSAFFALLWHHWRRTRWWLVLPLTLCTAWTLSCAVIAAKITSSYGLWNLAQTAMIGNLYILVMSALGLANLFGSGESNAVFPRYAQTLPVSDRRWTLSCIVYAGLVFGLLSLALTAVDRAVYDRPITDSVRVVPHASRPVPPPPIQPRTSSMGQAAPAPGLPGGTDEQRRREAERALASGAAQAPQAPPGPFSGRSVSGGAVSAEEALARWKTRAGVSGVPASYARLNSPRSFPERGWFVRWMEPVISLGVVFFCLSLFMALSLVPRLAVRVFLQALTLAIVPTVIVSMLLDYPTFLRAITPKSGLLSIPLFTFVVALAIMHATVVWSRHGSRGRFRRTVADAAGMPIGRGLGRFASQDQALQWYEWRVLGSYLLYGTLGIAVMWPWIQVSTATGVAVLVPAAFAGLYVAYKHYHGERSEHDGYLLTLPVTVERLSSSRLGAMARAVGLAWLAGLLVEGVALIGLHAGIAYGRPLPELALPWILVAVLAAWVLVWQMAVLFYPVVLIWLMWIAWYAAFGRPSSQILALGYVGVALLVMASAALLVWLARRRGQLTKSRLYAAAAAWAAAAVVAAATVPFVSCRLEHISPIAATLIPYALALALAILAATPIFGVPLAIDHYRHR